jgi:predicted transcriptional regulator
VKKDGGLSSFGLRLKEVFYGVQNKEIAHKLGVSNSAITTYMNGRVPPFMDCYPTRLIVFSFTSASPLIDLSINQFLVTNIVHLAIMIYLK